MKKGEYKLALITITFLLAGFFFLSKANAQELDKLKVYYQPSLSGAPIIIAYEEGFFKEQGIDLELVKARDTAEALILLIQGSLHIISGPLTAGIYNAAKEGKDVKLVAGMASYIKGNKFAGIIIGPNKDKDKSKSLIKNLKGRKIGIPILGSMPHYFLERLLQKDNISTKDVELVVMPFFSIVAAIKNNSLGAGFLVEPFIAPFMAKNEISFISFGDEFTDTPSAFIIYGEKLLTKNKDLGVKFMIAYLKGCKQYSQGKNETNIRILKKYLDFDDNLLKKTDWPIVEPEAIHNFGILEDYQTWLFENNYIDRKIDIGSIIDDSFLKEAVEIVSKREMAK